MTGRDKMVAGDDIIQVQRGARLFYLNLPRGVQIALGAAALAIVVGVIALIASQPQPPGANTEFIFDTSAAMDCA